MLYIDADNTVHLTRGDTAYLQVPIINTLTGQEYEIAADDRLTLSLKKNIKDAAPCMVKSVVGSNTFHILPEDTCTCDFTKYKYDVQLTTSSGDVYTVIVPTCFEIMPEVSA